MRPLSTLRHRRPPAWLRLPAAAAPVLLLLYGVLRLVDGRDGDHGPGLAWNLGHTLFLVAFVLFGVLIAGLRAWAPASSSGTRTVSTGAAAAGLVGACGFLWVILGDLFTGLDEAAPLPDPLYALCPVLFQLGLLVLLVLAVRAGLLPVWTPVLVLIGFTAIAVDLDLLPLGAVLILAGLMPLVRSRPA